MARQSATISASRCEEAVDRTNQRGPKSGPAVRFCGVGAAGSLKAGLVEPSQDGMDEVDCDGDLRPVRCAAVRSSRAR
jgi:hypothetical protein